MVNFKCMWLEVQEFIEFDFEVLFLPEANAENDHILQLLKKIVFFLYN